MKTVDVSIGKHTLRMLCNMDVYFDIIDKCGNLAALTEQLGDAGRIGYEINCWLAASMAEAGELARRADGYEPEPILPEKALRVCLPPKDYPALQIAVMQAITRGFAREEQEDYDEGLAELQKKTS